MLILVLLSLLKAQETLTGTGAYYDVKIEYRATENYIQSLVITIQFSKAITFQKLSQFDIVFDDSLDLSTIQITGVNLIMSESFLSYTHLIIKQTAFDPFSFYDPTTITIQNIHHQQKNSILLLTCTKGFDYDDLFFTLQLQQSKIQFLVQSNGATYKNSPIKLSFEFSHTKDDFRGHFYQDFFIQIDFTYNLGLEQISCSNYIGFSDSQDCTTARNGSLFVINRNPHFFYTKTHHEFQIDNLAYPPNLETYLIQCYIYNGLTLLDQGEFSFSASEVNQFDQLALSYSSNLATRDTLLKILVSSKYYILKQSNIIIQLSELLIVKNLQIKGYSISYSQNDKIITIPTFNDEYIDQISFIIELEFQNPDYMMDITFSLQIINISPCLQGNVVYNVQPNEYTSFIATRDTTVLLEATTLKIDIELSNPITYGQIMIQFPSELKLQNQIYDQMSGTKFTFTYPINNPNVCITGRFESQTYEDGKFKEKLSWDVRLHQTPNQLIQDLSIKLSPATTASKANMEISMSTQLQPQILFDDTFKQTSSIFCYNCTLQNLNLITLTSSQDKINYIRTPRSTKPQILQISITQNECSYSTVPYQIDFTPITKQFITKVDNNQLNQYPTWEFIIVLPTDIYTNDTFNIIFPNQLQIGQIQCSFQQLIIKQFDCSKPFQVPQFMGAGFIIYFYIQGLSNPDKFETLDWQVEVNDNEGYGVAIFQSQFSDWQYNTIQYTAITLLNYQFMTMKEAILRIKLQFPTDKIEYYGNQMIFCDNCTLNSQNIVTIIYQGNEYLEIPIRFFTIENQRTYYFEYNLTTYLNGAIQEMGFKRQTIHLICQEGCNECQGNFNNCTDCREGFLFNSTCIETCPTKYYGVNSVCRPCKISNCTACGYYAQKEICIGCPDDLDLYNNTCIVYQRTQNQTNTNTTTQTKPNITTTFEQISTFEVTYSFPGILIIIVGISTFTLISKIVNHTSVSKTLLLAHLGLLENAVAIFINFYFLFLGPKGLAAFSVTLILYQIFIQQDFLIHIYETMAKDIKYQQNLKSSTIFKMIHYISIGFNYMYFLMFTSQITNNPKWNCQWQDRKLFYEQLIVSLRNSMVYSCVEIAVMITTILYLGYFDSMLLEVIGLSCTSMYLNLWHQLKFDNLYDQQEML